MPKIPEKTSSPAAADKLRPLEFLGVEFVRSMGRAVGTCPFCDKPKLYGAPDTGQWQCKVCGRQGNALTFVRELWEISSSSCVQLTVLATERRINESALVAWGVRFSTTCGAYVVPGFDATGKLMQLYKRSRVYHKGEWVWRLLPVPGLWPDGKSHALHMAPGDLDAGRSEVYLCEGPWDGAAWWAAGGAYKRTSDPAVLDPTGSRSASILSDANVFAQPGCGVFKDSWMPLFRDKRVVLCQDSDHPVERHGKVTTAGRDAAERTARLLKGVAKSVDWVRWGEAGFDPDKPSGHDVRDELSSFEDVPSGVLSLLSKVEEVPADWFAGPRPSITANGAPREIQPSACSTWAVCEAAWAKALEWRQVMADVLSVMLAVTASTEQAGNQLFFQVLGDAGSAKTTMCEGLLVSPTCHHLEHLTGFHSGWKKPGADGKDCSLISRINNKTLVTPEGDVIVSSPNFAELMSQQRRIFDGKSGATYKNSDEDKLYTGLRTPWIMAGTMALLSTDQSRLGDRFLRVIIDPPGEDLKRRIIRSALRSEIAAMDTKSNGTAGSCVEPKLRDAQALTGGYVDWLRANVTHALSGVHIPEWVEDRCIDLAELTADLRARPDPDTRKQDVHDTKELPTRIARQLIRLAKHLAVVLNKREVDADVMRRVKKVALDTAYGTSLNIVKWLCAPNPRTRSAWQHSGLMVGVLSVWTGINEERMTSYLMFLRKIGVVTHTSSAGTRGSWRLTDRVFNLYNSIQGD